MTRRERLERKIDRRREWANKARERAEGRFAAASAVADNIPMGQPILIGHHSERHARRDAERIANNMDKGVEESRLAEHHAAKASGLEAALERTVFTDDHDAIEKLEQRAAEAEKKADLYNEINKAWKKSGGDVEKLVASGLVSRGLAERMIETMRLCPWHKKPLDTTSLMAAARRDRERIEQVKRLRELAKKAAEAGGMLIDRRDSGWATVTFEEKPANDILDDLRAAGFMWSGGSWHGNKDKLPQSVIELEAKHDHQA